MHRRNLLIVISLLLIPALAGWPAVDVGAIKVFGVGYVVHMFADQLNADYTLTFNHGFEATATKVVPIVAYGLTSGGPGRGDGGRRSGGGGQLKGPSSTAFRAKLWVPIDNSIR